MRWEAAPDKVAVTLLDSVRRSAVATLEFALPPRCPGCGTIVAQDHSFCAACFAGLQFPADPCCDRCALPLPHDGGAGALCGACLADPPAFDRVAAACLYNDTSRGLALKLKHGRRPGAARTMARLMKRNVVDANTLLVPVPLHRWRLWRRGYNQAALIARALARETSTAGCDVMLLTRVKSTPLLRGLGPAARRKAVTGAFKVAEHDKGKLAGRNILLVDDVFTTGSTANACAKALKRAGAARVEVHVWARVVRDGNAVR